MTDINQKPFNVVCSLPDEADALKSLCSKSPSTDAMNACHACLQPENLEEGDTSRMCVAKLLNADPSNWFAAMLPTKPATNLQCDPSDPSCVMFG